MALNEGPASGLALPLSRFSAELHGETQNQANLSCLSRTGKAGAHREQRRQATQIGGHHGEGEHIGDLILATQLDLANRAAMLFAVAE